MASRALDAEAIYRRLPTPLQHAACTVVGWHLNRVRYPRSFGLA